MIRTVLYRDLKTTVVSLALWAGFAVVLSLLGLLLLSMLDDYLLIQSQLQAKNINRGVEDLVILPYFRLSAYVGVLAMIVFASRLFYPECYSSYSALFRSSFAIQRHQFLSLWLAKCLWLVLVALFLVIVILIPILILRYFVFYQADALWRSSAALFYLFTLLGVVSFSLSRLFESGAAVSIAVIFMLLGIEFLGKVVVEPVWLQAIVYYFSPVKHFSELLVGKLFVSSIVFYLSVLVLCFCLVKRSFANDCAVIR